MGPVCSRLLYPTKGTMLVERKEDDRDKKGDLQDKDEVSWG